ncbi:hypothetical protein cypCar_00037171 [Cyprinus carpio]|nr:hypothetical protein cypCar_00037171 [Cyprinus carpio]
MVMKNTAEIAKVQENVKGLEIRVKVLRHGRLTVTGKGKGKGKEANRKVCLDPNKRQGQRLLKGKGRQSKKQRNRGRKEKIKRPDKNDDN